MKNDISRFIKAQAGVYETALAEIKNGRKNSHWIWYIFPQLVIEDSNLRFAVVPGHEAGKDESACISWLACCRPIMVVQTIAVALDASIIWPNYRQAVTEAF